MTTLNAKQTGLTLGLFFAILHALWAIIVAANYGQTLASWKLGMHFLSMSVQVTSFSIGTAIMLVIAAFVGGYVAGWVFAKIWNWTAKKVR